MATQQLRRKIGNKAKGRQHAHNKAYYETFRRKYALKKIRREVDREKRIAAKSKAKKKHPSDLRRAAARRLRFS